MRRSVLLLLTAATLGLWGSPAAAAEPPAVAYGAGYHRFNDAAYARQYAD